MYLNQKSSRSAFTLIELLIVISIIAILAAMTIAVTTQMVTRQRRVNTVNFFQSLDKILAKQVSTIRDRAMKEEPPQGVLNMAGGNRARARVIWVKLRLKQEFPQSFAEARAPYLPVNPFVDQNNLPSRYRGIPAAGAGNEESAICLYMALKRKRGGVSLTDEEVKPFVKKAANGMNMFVDGWGIPIRFYRFPYQNTHMNGTNPAPAGTKAARYRDPLDPDGLLLRTNWGNPGRAVFQQLCHPIASVYMVPTVASAGPDEKMSLNLWMGGTLKASPNSDNIYGYLIRSGGKGRVK